jgi:hypothetical protein
VVRALVGLGWSYLHGLQLLARPLDLLLLGWGMAWVGAFTFRLLACYYYYLYVFYSFVYMLFSGLWHDYYWLG